MTRTIVVDDQPGFRQMLHRLLDLAGLEFVGEAGDIPTARELVRLVKPELALVDVMLPHINGLEGVVLLKTACPELRIILVSAYRDWAEMFQTAAVQMGAEAFIAKDDLDVELLRTWQEEASIAEP